MSIPFRLMDSSIPDEEAKRRMLEWNQGTRKLKSLTFIAAAVGAISLIVIALINMSL